MSFGRSFLRLFGIRVRSRRKTRDRTWSNVTPVRTLPPWADPDATLSPRPAPPDLSDPKAQMEAIAIVAFETVPLLNREEARLLYTLEEAVKSLGAGYRLMAQTSLGEIIQPVGTHGSREDRRRAFASINSKRIDFCIFNRYGRLVIAIEYQGSGHYQERAFMRDAVKREAIRKAGVPYFEIPRDFIRGKVQAQIREVLAPPRGGPPMSPTGQTPSARPDHPN
jgi:hypothetical protein